MAKEMLVGRELEFAKLEALLSLALSAPHADCHGAVADGPTPPLSVYICGPPGTGKTATVGAVVKKLEQAHKFHFISLNCYATQSSTSLAKELLSKLGHNDVTAAKANRKLCEVFGSSKRPILILLDEVDNLQSSRSKQLLYTVFGWPAQFNGRVTVVGIANTLDLTQRQMPLLKLGAPPQLITFPAYTSEQLVAILEQRFSKSQRYDRKAMELCARKVSALKGDVRLAFDIASQMLGNSEAEENACRGVLKVINKTMASPCQRARLPTQTRTLLATLMRLVSVSSSSSADITRCPAFSASTSSLSVTRDRLFDAYLTVCERLKLAIPCPEEMDEMLALLESQSMVTLQRQQRGARGVGGGQTTVSFTVEMCIARAQINDNALISDIEQMDL